MAIKDWPEEDRPREKIIRFGGEVLSKAELLSVIIRTGNAGRDMTALDQARRLMCGAGSLRRLSRMSMSELCAFKGIGPAKAAQIRAALEFGRRFTGERIPLGEQFRSSRDTFQHYHERLRDEKKEKFYVVLLDVKNRKLGEIKVSEGSLTASIVHPREVFEPAIRESAAAVIFVHNHPSGDPGPSTDDIDLTRRLMGVASLLGIHLLDHVIVGDGRYVSFADEGLLE